MQQATVNLFADMGVQPFALLRRGPDHGHEVDRHHQADRDISSPATASTSRTAPARRSRARPATWAAVVAGVEVSTDGGTTWHPASGTTSWTYSWIVHGSPTANIKVVRRDDSGNVGTPGSRHHGQRRLLVLAVVGHRSRLGGLRRRQRGRGRRQVQVRRLRHRQRHPLLQGAGQHGHPHRQPVDAPTGTLLAQATFTGESASGWQSVTFSTPGAVTPARPMSPPTSRPTGTTPRRRLLLPRPARARRRRTLDSAAAARARQHRHDGQRLYAYSASSTFPTSSLGATNYWVDVMFSPIAGAGPGHERERDRRRPARRTSSWTAPATGGAADVLQDHARHRLDGADADHGRRRRRRPRRTTITGLTTGTTYTFTVQAINAAGNGPGVRALERVTPRPRWRRRRRPASPRRPASSRPGELDARRSDGGSPITGYTVTPYIGATAQTPVQVGASATTTTVTGLTNGTGYTFKVTATNAVGTSPRRPPRTP